MGIQILRFCLQEIPLEIQTVPGKSNHLTNITHVAY